MMGYYVTLTDDNFVIPAEHEAAALQALKDLNKRDDLKTGGSWSGGRQTAKWFAWMAPDYDKTVESVADVFEMLGFDTDVTDDGTHLLGYDNKTGAEEHFLAVVAPFVEDGSFLEWRGEDGAMWRHVVENGKLHTKSATITWV